MPRETIEATQGTGATFTCDSCNRSQQRRVARLVGSVDDSARVAGWIIGPGGKPVWCPACTGKDADYWIDWAKTPDWALAQWLAGGE
jgi:hypothetical protein